MKTHKTIYLGQVNYLGEEVEITSLNQIYNNETITEVCKRILAEDGFEIWKWTMNPEDRMELICEGRKYDRKDNLIDKITITITPKLFKYYLHQ